VNKTAQCDRCLTYTPTDLTSLPLRTHQSSKTMRMFQSRRAATDYTCGEKQVDCKSDDRRVNLYERANSAVERLAVIGRIGRWGGAQ
jgi:hypothetical protein